MSVYTRLASTDAQEESISKVVKAFKQASVPIVGYVTIGKSPQTVLLDINYQGGEVRVNRDGEIEIKGQPFDLDSVSEMSSAIKVAKK